MEYQLGHVQLLQDTGTVFYSRGEVQLGASQW
jgi:hypothetical protein